MSRWKNRIESYGEEDPVELRANSHNWRTHGKNQKKAFAQVADEIGLIDDVIVNRRTSPEWGDQQGVATLIDGHLRVELAQERQEPALPVKYVDLAPGEEKLALATFDPLGGMAVTDRGRLDELLGSIQEGYAAMLADAGLETTPVEQLVEKIQQEAEVEVARQGARDTRELVDRHMAALAEQAPEKLAGALAVVVPAKGTRELLVLADPCTADIIAELRRYVDAGERSPLDCLLAEVHSYR